MREGGWWPPWLYESQLISIDKSVLHLILCLFKIWDFLFFHCAAHQVFSSFPWLILACTPSSALHKESITRCLWFWPPEARKPAGLLLSSASSAPKTASCFEIPDSSLCCFTPVQWSPWVFLLAVTDFSRCGQGVRQFVRSRSSLAVILDFLVLWLIAAVGAQSGFVLSYRIKKLEVF
jgi:hypothetical protein